MKFKFITPEDLEYQKARMLRWEHLLKPQGLPPGTEAMAHEEDYMHLVALEKKDVVGCVVFRKLSEAKGYIDQLALSEEYRGRGFVRKLMHMLEDEAYKKGIKEIDIETPEELTSLYEALGYKKTGEALMKYDAPYRLLTKRIEEHIQAVNL